MTPTELFATAAPSARQRYRIRPRFRGARGGTTSARPGDKALVTGNGAIHGWIGGGCAQPASSKRCSATWPTARRA